jgi:hypothetical protein
LPSLPLKPRKEGKGRQGVIGAKAVYALFATEHFLVTSERSAELVEAAGAAQETVRAGRLYTAGAEAARVVLAGVGKRLERD